MCNLNLISSDTEKHYRYVRESRKNVNASSFVLDWRPNLSAALEQVTFFKVNENF